MILSEKNKPKDHNIEFTLKAVGDICPGDKSILWLGICSLMKKHGADYPLKNVKCMFDDTDIVIGNLEGLLSRRMQKKDSRISLFAGCLNSPLN